MAYDPLNDSDLFDEETYTPTPVQTNAVAEHETPDTESSSGLFEQFWTQIAHAGLVEPFLRSGTLLLSLLLVLIVVWVLRSVNLSAVMSALPNEGGGLLSAPQMTPTPQSYMAALPPLTNPEQISSIGIGRLAKIHTTIPTRARSAIIQYTVEFGDSVFGIAEQFGLKPESILWANTATLQDNPHQLQEGQVLNIMPVDGTYHTWSEGEQLAKVAEFYGVDANEILQWPGNNFDLTQTTVENFSVEAGTMLIIPGGQRALIDYGPPRIPRDNPAVARTYGPGHCGTLADGIIGDGVFIWPTASHWLSGYDYNPAANHSGIDIGGKGGDTISAIDDGVVVYAGWSYSGYGNLVVIDHGNDWQSLYAHLDTYYVNCGESIYQGATIGAMGSTGASSGPHLHFEILYGSARVNPWNFLP